MDEKKGPEAPAARLVSLDAYRGLIMISLAFGGFGLAGTAELHKRAGQDTAVWQSLRYQFDHVQWVGCGYWDLIQPSFMFMVGVAAAFSYAKRQRDGQSWGGMFGHALVRSLVLIFLGIFLISNFADATAWSLMNVLTQIGLGYPFLFLLWGRSVLIQAAAVVAILAGTWLLYTLYPTSGINLESGDKSVEVSAKWAQDHLKGVPPAWHKNANVGHAIDLWLFNNMMPQREGFYLAGSGISGKDVPPRNVWRYGGPFEYNGGGYATINFIPSLATMLLGLMAGELLRSSLSGGYKLLYLLVAGWALLGVGMALHLLGVCPLVKRLWTPSWALFSTGWCFLILAGFFLIVDLAGWKAWTFPLVVVGMNSIAIYCMEMMLKPWAAWTWRVHLGQDVMQSWGALWEPTLRAILVGTLFWVMCWWMYRQRIFIRI